MKPNKTLFILMAVLLVGGVAWYVREDDFEPMPQQQPKKVESMPSAQVEEELDEGTEIEDEEETLEPTEALALEIDSLEMLEFTASNVYAEFSEAKWDDAEVKSLLAAMAPYHTEKITRSNPLELMMQKQVGFNELDEGIKARKEALDRGEAATPISESAFDALGLVLAMNSPALTWPLSLDEKTAYMKGVQLALAGKKSKYTFTDEQVKAFIEKMNNKVKERMKTEAESKKASNLAYLEGLENAQKDPSGFYYEIKEEGSGDKPGPTSEVTVHYHGTLIDGTVFDSSRSRGEPATFGMNQVIPAFSGGLSKVAAGGKVVIYAPPELAYGDQNMGSIPAGSVLIFDCELIEVK